MTLLRKAIFSLTKCTILCGTSTIPRVRVNAFIATPTIATIKSKSSYTTSLHVSELHIPGYAQTKLAFILPDDEKNAQTAAATLVKTRDLVQERTFDMSDYSSLIPYQDGHLLHKTNSAVFTPDECQLIIDEAEQKATEMGWTTKRHGNFPTTDLPLAELPQTLQFFRYALVERIYPLLRSQFGQYLPDGGKNLRVADGFVVKYDAEGGQTELKPHRDGSVLSFNILLNPSSEFEGGGTWFASLDDAVGIEQGEVVSHSSSLLHGGHGITSGKRYIMVCFVILEGYDSWSMRFYNQVRNL
ncbi:hypothetical protein ACHAXM_000947 [Skeletonema potamos]|jgi:hypothetical protein